MSGRARWRALALAAAFVAAPAAGQALPDWLAGCWAGQGGSAAAGAIEVWTAPAGPSMLGLGRTVRGARASFEFLRIEKTAQGLDYVAQPGGRPPTRFASVEIAPGKLVFANPQHDFPQRIEYAREGDTLRAEIATTDRGKRASFVFARADCTALIEAKEPTR